METKSNKLVYVKTEHVMPIRTLFEVLKDILPDVTIEFLNSSKKKEGFSGIKMMHTNPTKTILIRLCLEAGQFQAFECSRSKFSIGVNLTQMYKILKTMDKEDELILEVNADEPQFLSMSMNNCEIKKKTECKLKLMDIDSSTIGTIPETNMDVNIFMNSAEFHRICKEMIQMAKYVEIQCTSQKITFKCKGECAERTTTFLTNEKGVKINNIKDKKMIIQGIYELDNLNIFAKCTSLCGEIQIFMRMDYPLCIKYTVASLGSFLVCIAPVSEEQTQNGDDDGCTEEAQVEIKENDD